VACRLPQGAPSIWCGNRGD